MTSEFFYPVEGYFIARTRILCDYGPLKPCIKSFLGELQEERKLLGYFFDLRTALAKPPATGLGNSSPTGWEKEKNCIYIYVCVCAWKCIHIYADICVYIYLYIYIYVCKYLNSLYICIYIYSLFEYIYNVCMWWVLMFSSDKFLCIKLHFQLSTASTFPRSKFWTSFAISINLEGPLSGGGGGVLLYAPN